jgi:hypothetical protein
MGHVPGIGAYGGLGSPRFARWGLATSAVSSAATITQPAGIEPGDLLLLLQFAINSSGLPTAVTPAGYSNIINSTTGATNVRFMLSHKPAVGNEDSVAITGMNGNNHNSKVLAVFRGYDQYGNVLNPTSFGFNTPTVGALSVADPAPQTIVHLGDARPIIALNICCAQATLVDTGMVMTRNSVNVRDGAIVAAARSGIGYAFGNDYGNLEAFNTVVDITGASFPALSSLYCQGTA